MGDVSMLMSKKDDCIDLPPGFRFHPSDEEIVTHYLYERVKDASFSAIAIGEADLNKCEPWDLPKLATMGEKEYYFFCERDKKYPTGMRTNRATISGYWKATGKDKEIYKGKGCLVGMKKTLVFYLGRAPKGEKTNWVMHEYRLEGKTSYWKLPKNAKDEWVVCRVFHKNTGLKKNPDTDMCSMNPSAYGDNLSENSTLPPLAESPYLMSNNYNPSSSFISNNEGGDHFRGIHTGASTSTSSYVIMDRYQIENLQKGFAPNCYSTMASNSSLYQHIPTPNMPCPNMGYSHHGDFRGFGAPQYDTASPLRRHCKVEQFSNQSGISASPETSGISRQEMEMVHGNNQTCNDVVDGQISSRTLLVDLDSLLNKYS